MKVEYLEDIENANHPQVLYWFWTPDMIEEGTYIEELENIYETMSFDLLFMTSRDGLSFFDYDQVVKPFRETVKRAHELNIKIGLQLWRNPEAATIEDALALVVEGEETLDDDGFLEYEAESVGHRDQESLKSEIFKVVIFQKISEGTYKEGSLIDVTDQCEVLDSDLSRIRLALNIGSKYAGYTAYLLTAHYHRSPDLFSDCSINSFRKAIDTYSEVPFDGIGLDEFKSMPIAPPWVAMWHPFRSRLYGASFDEYFQKETGLSLVDTIIKMRYVAKGDEVSRIKSINYYFDLLKDGPIRVENFVNDYAKEVYGEDTFIGLHNTYHNKLTNDEIWETGCMWWDLPRDYGHTDEDIAYPIRMGIACSHPKSVLYDMYYTEGEKMPIYKKAIKDARYNNRIHYHAYNDRRPNRFDMKNKNFSDTITEIERKVKLLNHFDGPHPELDLLIVFGRPALANWYPNHEHRNEYDINGGLFIIEKSQALWDAGIMCALVPSNKIEQGTLKIRGDNKIDYNGHVFDSILYLYPEYSKKSTLDFLETCSLTDNLLLIEGQATCDFDGSDCSEQFKRIAKNADLIDFSVEAVLEKGVAKNALENGCRLEDGSVILTDLPSIIHNKARSFELIIGKDNYSGKYIGAMAIKVDEQGALTKFVAGGFKELCRNNEVILSLSSESDIVVTRIDGDLDIKVIGLSDTIKVEVVNDYE